MRFIALQEKWRSWMASEFPTFDFSKPDNCISDDRPYHELPSSAPDKPVEIVAKHDDVLLVEAKVSTTRVNYEKCLIDLKFTLPNMFFNLLLYVPARFLYCISYQ